MRKLSQKLGGFGKDSPGTHILSLTVCQSMTLASAILSTPETRIPKMFLGHWLSYHWCQYKYMHFAAPSQFLIFFLTSLYFYSQLLGLYSAHPFFQAPHFCYPTLLPVISPTSLNFIQIRGHFIDVTSKIIPFLLVKKLNKHGNIFQVSYSFMLFTHFQRGQRRNPLLHFPQTSILVSSKFGKLLNDRAGCKSNLHIIKALLYPSTSTELWYDWRQGLLS